MCFWSFSCFFISPTNVEKQPVLEDIYSFNYLYQLQEEYMEGCNDGTFPATGERIFECPPGHGLYFPLANLRPDERVGGATGGALCRE